jgi:aryl-alcohol dehydrogenase-like predicted oxidoreductase
MNKLALGTVQFGLDYGVTNSTGKVQIREVASILEYAKEKNINVLDTAAGYGNSEEILGRIGINHFQIITKTTFIKNGVDKVIESFYQSLKNLNQQKVDGLLIHNIEEVKHEQFDVLFKKLTGLKLQGLIDKIGFSTYTPEQIDFLLKNFDFDLIQVPFNVFDTRLLQGGQLKRLKNKGIEIHARSVFLQGILLDFNDLPSYFFTWENQFNVYQDMINKSGLSKLEYALNFALSIKELDKILVGVYNVEQLQEIITASQRKIRTELVPFSIDDIHLLNPSLWTI